MPDDATHRSLHARRGHRRGAGRRVLAAATDGREHEPRMVVGDPMLAKRRQCAGWQRDEPVLGALAAMDVDEHAGAVDVAQLKGESFLEPQAQRVDGPEEGAIVRSPDGVEEPMHLVDGQDVGQRLMHRDAELEERGPFARHGMGEEVDAAVGDLEGAGGEFAVVLQEQGGVADLRLGEQVRGTPEVRSQIPDGTDVGFLGPLAAARELKILDHPLAERGHGARSSHRETLSQRRKKEPLRTTMITVMTRVQRPPPHVRRRGPPATIKRPEAACRAAAYLNQMLQQTAGTGKLSLGQCSSGHGHCWAHSLDLPECVRTQPCS